MNPVARVGGLAVILVTSLFLLGVSGPVRGADQAATNAMAIPIEQKMSDLLAGLAKGVCYSGFRHGQHPDRGDGGINPGDKEILEDLRILARDGNFRMIRLYDSQTNSEAVLRLIREHKLKLKVMLGAWLNAEVSNPGCPWLKTPIAQPVLD